MYAACYTTPLGFSEVISVRSVGVLFLHRRRNHGIRLQPNKYERPPSLKHCYHTMFNNAVVSRMCNTHAKLHAMSIVRCILTFPSSSETEEGSSLHPSFEPSPLGPSACSLYLAPRLWRKSTRTPCSPSRKTGHYHHGKAPSAC